jgi:hypothetical protein
MLNEQAANMPNVALGKRARQSSVCAASRGGSVFDDAAGAVNGKLTGGYQFHTDLEDMPWWQVDLGAPHMLAEIRLYNRIDDREAQLRLNRFQIECSIDGEVWNTLYTHDGKPVGGADGHPLVVRAPDETRQVLIGRHLRIKSLERTWLHLDQVAVYGAPRTDDAAHIEARVPPPSGVTAALDEMIAFLGQKVSGRGSDAEAPAPAPAPAPAALSPPVEPSQQQPAAPSPAGTTGMRTILIDETQIGDTITAFPALYTLATQGKFRLWLRCAPARSLWAGPPVEMLAQNPGEGDRFKILPITLAFADSGLDMAQAWMAALGLPVSGEWSPPPLAAMGAVDHEVDVVISPYCRSHGGGWKLLDFNKWNKIIDTLLGAGRSVTIAGVFGPGEDPKFWGDRKVHVIDSLPLPHVVTYLRAANCVVTLDSGLGHMANLLAVPHVHMVSAHPFTCRKEWVMNRRPNARVVYELFRTLQPERVLSAVFDVLAQSNPEEFDGDLYLQANPDLVLAGVKDPWQHFVEFGIKEGRSLRPRKPDNPRTEPASAGTE